MPTDTPSSELSFSGSPVSNSSAKTLFDKIWESHAIEHSADGTALLYIDRHLIHEVTSPQAFEGLRKAGRSVLRPETTLAVVDHNVPTRNRELGNEGVKDTESRIQIETLEKNCRDFNLNLFSLNDKRQGIVHVIGPEQGLTQPGMTIVCGDSHTATHGAFGALAFGIGTSEVEHVLATQTLRVGRLMNMRIKIVGEMPLGVSAKDIILAVIGKIGTAGGTGHVIEYAGEVIQNLSMEARMTICNMSIEAGARAGLIEPDQKTFDYLKGRPLAPKGDMWEKACQEWRQLSSDEGAHYEREETIKAADIAPQVTWGTSPEQVVPITDSVPAPTGSEQQKTTIRRALDYMGLQAGTRMQDISIDKVFIGSCTNGRIEDLRTVAKIVKNKRVAKSVHAMVVPGSGLVKAQAAQEGIEQILIEAGFEWRDAGCSMCLGMNEDQLTPQQRCASTSNRNFEGRQGRGGRTHLMSPAMAAAAAIAGKLTDVRSIL